MPVNVKINISQTTRAIWFEAGVTCQAKIVHLIERQTFSCNFFAFVVLQVVSHNTGNAVRVGILRTVRIESQCGKHACASNQIISLHAFGASAYDVVTGTSYIRGVADLLLQKVSPKTLVAISVQSVKQAIGCGIQTVFVYQHIRSNADVAISVCLVESQTVGLRERTSSIGVNKISIIAL